MDYLLMILLAFVIGYMFKNMCRKRVEGYGECTHTLKGCASAACQGIGHDDQCDDWQNHLRDKPLKCKQGMTYHNYGARAGDPYECL